MKSHIQRRVGNRDSYRLVPLQCAMRPEVQAIKDGKMWYLVVNRSVFEKQGLPPVYKDPIDPTKTTKWRPYYMYDFGGKCISNRIDIAVFEDELPDGIRKQLK